MLNIFGVPCSKLKAIAQEADVPCTDEEEAFALAYGAMLTGKSPIVYMQDSGFCKCLNILLSLYMSTNMPYPKLVLSIRNEPEYHTYVSDRLFMILRLINYQSVDFVR
jgi:sulfopyruvate decarboxylase TPP-binding subunit